MPALCTRSPSSVRASEQMARCRSSGEICAVSTRHRLPRSAIEAYRIGLILFASAAGAPRSSIVRVSVSPVGFSPWLGLGQPRLLVQAVAREEHFLDPLPIPAPLLNLVEVGGPHRVGSFSFFRGPVVVGHLRTCSKSEQRKSRIVHCSATSEMPTLFYIFAISFAGVFLYVAVNRFEPNRPLAILLMILLVGITAAAVLNHLMP